MRRARRISPHRGGPWRDSSVGATLPPRGRGSGGASLRVTRPLTMRRRGRRYPVVEAPLGRGAAGAGLLAVLAADSSAHGYPRTRLLAGFIRPCTPADA